MPDTPQDIERLVSEYMEHWRRADIPSILSMYAKEIRYHDMSTDEVIEYDDLERFLTNTFAIESDSNLEYRGLVHLEGNAAFIRWTQQLNTADPSKTVDVSGVELIVFDDDKIVSVHEFYDYREMGRDTDPRSDSALPSEQMAKLGFDDEQARNVALEIERVFERDKPYLQSDLSLLHVAERLGHTRNQVSYVFNHVLGYSFYDFVNKHRVAHVIEHMRNTEKSASIIELAIDAGFNSISGFYKAFKKQTGMTPTAYRKAMADEELQESTRTRTDDP